MRTYIISNVYKNAASIFPIKVDAKVFTTAFDRSQIPEIIALLHNPNKPEPYPRYPSVFYKDGAIMGGNLFGSTAIINVSTPTVFLHRRSLNLLVDTQKDTPRSNVSHQRQRETLFWPKVLRCS